MAGRLTIVVLDNGSSAANVPQNSTQLVIGTCQNGTVGAPFASTSPTNIFNNFGNGPLTEAAGLIASVGGVPVCIRATSNTAGSASAVTTTGGGTSVITVTGTPLDTAQVLITVTSAGTIGTAGITFTASYDNGRTTSPSISLSTATTYPLPNLGATLNFAAGTVLLGQTMTFGTVEPLWNSAGIQAAITAFLASSYAKQGVGSAHIVGGSTATNGASGAAGADMLAIGLNLQSARQNQFVFTRAYLSARDTKVPVAFGGAAETEAAWMTAISSDFQGQNLNTDTTGRTSVCAAYWNTQSVYQNGLGIAPRFRRSVAYAVAQRQVLIPTQRMPSRVRDGALAPIVIAAQDKTDGFVYHDESITPGLDSVYGGSGGNFTTTTTIVGKSGVFCQHANLFSPAGSQYGYMPQGLVTDVACSIAYQVGINNIDDELRITPVGTIDPRDAVAIQSTIQRAISGLMTTPGMLTSSPQIPDGCIVTVNQQALITPPTMNVPIQVTLNRKGYILTETITVGAQPGT
jgi:hypothetical protein